MSTRPVSSRARWSLTGRVSLLLAAMLVLLLAGTAQAGSLDLPDADAPASELPDADVPGRGLPDPAGEADEQSDPGAGSQPPQTEEPATDRSLLEGPQGSAADPSPVETPDAGTPDAGAEQADPSQAEPSQEEGMELHCPGTALLHFDPGVTPEPSRQTVTGEMRGGTEMDPRMPCTSPTGVPYQGGIAELKGSGEIGCASAGPVMDIAGTADIFWDNGDESKAVWSVVSYGLAPVVDVRIVEGALAPAQVFQQGTPTGFNGNCGAQPLTSASFTGVAHVISEEQEADPGV